jgi:3-oxoacyl-[acyl-carrier protein] reductase
MTREVGVRVVEGREGGVVVNISSLSRAGNEGQSAYSASNAGVDAAMRSWALEFAPHGIRVAAIAPGVVQTPILDNVSDEARGVLLSRISLGRFGRPQEIWQALRFILECDYFNGRVLEVDGGAVA